MQGKGEREINELTYTIPKEKGTKGLFSSKEEKRKNRMKGRGRRTMIPTEVEL